jgi:hypothetical protein
MENIKEYISKKRPSLSKSSLTTYGSILKNLYRKVFEEEDYNLDRFKTPAPVLKYLEGIPPNRRKTILSALVIITDNKQYRDLMLKDVRDYNADINKQEKSEKQEQSWVEKDAVNKVVAELRKNAEAIMKKSSKTISDLQEIQNYIILCVLGGAYISPRRSKDFVDFKIRNIDTNKDNYMEKNKFIFNSYKTAKTYGKQVVDIPVQLKNIIAKWIKINPTENLFFDANMNKLSAVKLNQRLNKIFNGKKVGVNQLRHTYLTDKFADTIKKEKAISDTMEDMGSSKEMLKTYVKKD